MNQFNLVVCWRMKALCWIDTMQSDKALCRNLRKKLFYGTA